MKELTVKKNDAGQRLDRFVGKAVPLLPEALLPDYHRLSQAERERAEREAAQQSATN